MEIFLHGMDWDNFTLAFNVTTAWNSMSLRNKQIQIQVRFKVIKMAAMKTAILSDVTSAVWQICTDVSVERTASMRICLNCS